MAADKFAAWRSPPPHETPLVEPSSLPKASPLKLPNSPAAPQPNNNDLIHPAFLPPCEHGKDDDMHAHAFDLLSLSNASPAQARSPLPAPPPSAPAVPSSVPNPTSVLSATRPPISSTVSSTSAAGSAPKARRMSSSTTGVLGRGKLGLTGEGSLGLGGMNRDSRPAMINHGSSYTGSTPVPNRRPSAAAAQGTSPTPQLFDFAKTDRRPAPRAVSTANSSTVPASLPTHSTLLARGRHIHPDIIDDMELDMAFDGDEEDDEEGESGRSGSAEIDMELDEDDDGEVKPELKKLALGNGSGGVKGRRKGMVFKCENCGKEYRHPSCLVKHRWEHSPHWKEPTQLSMSKHQQVQMLEAATILAYLHPSQGKLPVDRSLWPAVTSPPVKDSPLRRASVSASRDLSAVRSPSSSNAPLTPSSLRESSTLANMGNDHRKSSPGSDSTTSSIGDGYPTNGLNGGGLRNGQVRSTRPVGIDAASSLSSVPGPNTPQSVGSLPNELAGLHFHSHSHSGNPLAGYHSHSGVSPIPHRGMPLSLKAGLIGGGMFGAINTSVPSSSVRSGAMADDEEEDYSSGGGRGARGKSSSEEAEERRKGREGEEWGMAMEMEL